MVGERSEMRRVVQLLWSNSVPELVTTVTKLALAVLIMLRFIFDVKIFLS